MKELFKDMLKGAAICFTIGVAVSFVLPFLAMATGIAPAGSSYAAAAVAAGHVATNPLWLGAFFGAWGAFEPPVKAAYNMIFGKENASEIAAVANEKSDGKDVNITIVHSPQQSQGQTVIDSKFQQTLEAKRLAVAGEQVVIS